MGAPFKYHPGDQFGDWTLVEYSGSGRWLAKCKCGKQQDCFIDHLAKGNSTRCRDCCTESRKSAVYFHESEYQSWSSAKQRCTNINNDRYEQYGGRGITMCAEWDDFAAFLSDMGPRPAGTSLDRIDVDGPYNKENCRWATPKEQMRNKRVHKIRKCVTELAEQSNIPHGTLRARLRRGWTLDRAINEPVHTKSKSICAQAKDRGLSPATVLCRVNRGWPIEKALSTPIQQRRAK